MHEWPGALRQDPRALIIVAGSSVTIPLTPPSHNRRATSGSFTVQTCVGIPTARAARAIGSTGMGKPRKVRVMESTWYGGVVVRILNRPIGIMRVASRIDAHEEIPLP